MEDVATLTLNVLKEIRDEVRKTNERLDQTNERLDQTNERLDGTNERLDRVERRQTEAEVRLATELVALSSAVREVRDLLTANLNVRDKIEQHEARISALERKAG
jgi:chromosome segregation ATPase